MRIKSFFAASMEEAMAAARTEFGPEAMVVQTRESVGEARVLGAFEVVAATDGESSPATRAAAGDCVPAVQSGPTDRLSFELAEMRRDLDRMRKAIARSGLH